MIQEFKDKRFIVLTGNYGSGKTELALNLALYYANAGIYLIKRSALEEIPEDTFFNATDLIEKLIAENKKVIRFPLNGTWIDIGNPQEYQKANELVKHMII